MKRLSSLAGAVIAALTIAACGGSPKPVGQIASSEGAIRGASEAGAANVPAATLYLKLAQEEREQALDASAHGHQDRASGLLARSEADAELAIALSKAARAEHDANQANATVEDLKGSVQ